MELGKETLAVHAGRPQRFPGAALNVSPVFSSTYVAGTERIYARETQDATQAFEDAMSELEGGTAVGFSSGMAAVGAVLDHLQSSHRGPLKVLVSKRTYGGTLAQLVKRQEIGQVDLTVIDALDSAQVIEGIAGRDLIWVETPSNPMLSVYDIAAIAMSCKDAGARLCVDSTFATPIIQNPLDLGADFVVHSASKYIGGHSDLIAGVVVAKEPADAKAIRSSRTLYGAILGPMEAFLALRGLRTLALRVERSSDNALALASMLVQHSAVVKVNYPFLDSSPYFDLAKSQMRYGGAMLSFELVGGAYEAERFCDWTQIGVNSTSLGGVETQLERRARHKGENISESLIRVSVGIESSKDINLDFSQALIRLYGPS